MLVTHLHFGGRCDEAIEMYSKAFETTVDFIDRDEAGGVIHAEMHILGSRIMMNDNYGSKDNIAGELTIHMVPIFKTRDELLRCFDILKSNAISISQPEKVSYSPLIAGVTDKFGISWGLMVGE